uniref:Uncharacterized protein n=1 Tax=Tanacetum cinerariifolium TaxID=118510 RepID=A0A6L2JKX9_TANCI|nr:hypothetical protein [Tanacetum cinerariifolium]
MDFRIFIMQEIDDVADSDDASTRDNENPLVGTSLPPLPKAGRKLRSLGKRQLPSGVEDSLLKSVLRPKRTRELISALDKATASCDAIRARELEKDKAYTELERKCNEALFDLDKNPLVTDMWTEIETLQGHVDGFESKRERLKLSEIQLLQEMDALKQDRASVVAKVVPDAAIKLIRSDEIGILVMKLVTASIIYGRCAAFKEVAKLKDPFVMDKMAGYRPSSKQKYDQAGDDLANASYPFLSKYVNDPYASLEQLLSKKPKSLHSKPSGPMISIPHCEKGQADVIDVISCFGFLGPECILQDPSCTSFMMLLACIGPTHLNHSDMYDLRYSLSSIILYSEALMRSFLSFCGSFGRIPSFRRPIVFLAMHSPVMSASYFASLLVVLNSNLNAHVYSFPFGFTNISPALEPSKLEALSVNSFHVFFGSGSFLLAPPSFSYSLFVDDVSARKSASIRPLIEFLPVNSISCSPNLMTHLATSPDFSCFARTCFIGMSLGTCTGCAWKYLWSFLAAYTRASMSFSNSGYFCSAPCSV